MAVAVITRASGGLPVKDLGGPGGMAVTEVAPALGGIAVTKVAGAGAGMGVTFVSATGGPVTPLFTTFDDTPAGTIILSNNNLTVTKDGTIGGTGNVRSNAAFSSGKYYFEITNTVKSTGTTHKLGLAQTTAVVGDVTGGLKCVVVAPANATTIYSNNVDQSKVLGTAASGNRYDFAIDLTGRRAWIRRAGGNWNGDAAANPATGTNGVVIGAGSFAPFVYLSNNSAADSITANFGASAFVGAVPSGFTAGWPA